MRLTTWVTLRLCPPRAKKLSWMPGLLHAEYRAPDALDHAFGRRAGSDVPVAVQCLEIRRRERAAIDLTVREQGKAIEHDERRRDHVLRQTCLEMAAQLGTRVRATFSCRGLLA